MRQGYLLLTQRFLDPVTRGWLVVVSGNVARLLLSLVASVLIARALGPADYGVLAVLSGAMAIAGIVADLGLTATAVKGIAGAWPGDAALAHWRGRATFWLRTAAALAIFALAGLLAVPLTAGLLGLGEVQDAPILFVLAMAGMVAVAMSGAVNAVLQATSHFGRLSAVSLANAAVTAVLAGLLAAAGRLNLVTALLVLGLATTAVSIGMGLRLLPGRWSLWRPPSWPELRDEGQTMLRFGRWLWIASLLAVTTGQLDLILLSHWREAGVVGLYALALSLAMKADVVNQSLYTALLPSASTLAGETSLRPYLRRALLRGLAISAGLLLLAPLAGPFIALFYGEAYQGAAPLVPILLLTVIFDALTLPVALLAYPLERPQALAAAELLRATALLALVALFIPRWGPAGAALARLGAKAIAFGLLALLLRSRRSAIA
jgi:PST family polysaccharide transporter